MKKLLLLLILALCAPIAFAQNLPSYVPTNGLVAYYPFSGNANEQIGNTNNGTVNGATLTNDINGIANSAYNYNGTSSYINLPMNFYGGQTATLVSFRLRFKISSNGHSFIWNKDGNWTEAGIYTTVNGAFGIFWAYPNQYNGIVTSNGSVVPNIWYDAVIIINGSNSKIYLNGIEQTGVTINTPSNSISFSDAGTCGSGINRFGFKKDSCSPANYFNGVLDEFMLYNRALTQQEITNLYNSSLPQTACLPPNVPTTGLVGYWPFCGNANDESGNGNNGTVNGATLTTDRFGNSISAYNFSGGSNVSVPMTFLLHNLPTRTFSCWFNANGAQNGGRIYETTYLNGGIAMSNGNFLDAWYYNGTNECNVTNINTGNLNEWHNLVYVTDSNTGLGSIYLDGVFINSRNGLPFTSPSNWLNNFLRFGLGAQGESFIGKIDDIGIWNRALTQQEITNLFNANQCITNITVTDTLIINVGQLSFNHPVTWANNITIAPNPANSQININFNNITDLNGGTIKIINSLGQQITTTPITLSGTNTSMQLSTWGGAGLYFVQIINAQGIVVDVKKIILQ